MRNSLLGIFLLLATLLSPIAYGMDEDIKEINQFVDDTAKHVLSIVSNKSMGAPAKQAALTQIFVTVVDIDFMARSALGAQWRNLDKGAAAQYLKAYHQYIISLYVAKFRYYHEHNYSIKSITKRDNQQYKVAMAVTTPDGSKDIDLSYLLARHENSFKIRDIIVENVSLLSTQRSDFSSVLSQQGLDNLLALLDTRVQNNEEGNE